MRSRFHWKCIDCRGSYGQDKALVGKKGAREEQDQKDQEGCQESPQKNVDGLAKQVLGFGASSTRCRGLG